MTGMLASVATMAEARLALQAGVAILDLKQPADGALGALDTATIRKIVQLVDNRIPVSATIGDLAMQPEIVSAAVRTMADTGVDYIKIGFFPAATVQDALRFCKRWLAGVCRSSRYCLPMPN